MTQTETRVFTIVDQASPNTEGERRKLYKPYAYEILTSYKELPTDTDEVSPLNPQLIEQAIKDALPARRVTFANTLDGEFAGFFAYTTHDRQTAPELFQASSLNESPYRDILSSEERKHVEKALTIVDTTGTVLEVHEMMVPVKHRKHNLSHRMRMKALAPFENKPIIVIGNIQNQTSIKQRQKLRGVTFWGGEVLIDTNQIPYGLSEKEFRAFASVWVRRGVVYHASDPGIHDAIETLDEHGILGDIGVFVKPLEPPEEIFDERYKVPIERILKRQDETSIASGVAVTLCFPKVTQPLNL